MEKNLEYNILEGQRKEVIDRLDSIGHVFYYAVPCTVVGTISGFIGGLTSYLLTRDPIYMAYGTAVGGIIGAIAGIASSTHLTLNELEKINQARQDLV